MSNEPYRERRGTTPKSRTKAAIHAAATLRMWEWPLDVPATENWVPSVARTIAKTRDMYNITPLAAEAQEAVDVVRARNVETSTREMP